MISFENILSIGKILGGILLLLLPFLLLTLGLFHFLENPPKSRLFFKVTNSIIFFTTILLLLYPLKKYRFENKYFQLLQNTILYIPCLVYTSIDWVKYQYSITTPTALIILGLDIALVIMKFMIWPKINAFIKHQQIQGTVLLDKPIFLNTKTTLGTYENMKVVKNNKNFRYRYGISFWIYINPQPPNTSPAYSKYSVLVERKVL